MSHISLMFIWYVYLFITFVNWSSSLMQWLSDRKKRQLQKNDAGEFSITHGLIFFPQKAHNYFGLIVVFIVSFSRHPAQDRAHPGLWDAHSVQLHQSVERRAVHPGSWWDVLWIKCSNHAGHFIFFDFWLFVSIYQALTSPGFAVTTPIICPWSLNAVWILTVSHPLVHWPSCHWWLNLTMFFFSSLKSFGLWHPVWWLL